jgi:Domain of unknown function (DUF4260)
MAELHRTRPTHRVIPDAPKWILRSEGLALLGAAAAAYAQTGTGWILFAILFLLPDVFMLGYLREPRFGAMVYNVGHSTILPFALIGLGLAVSIPTLLSVGLIWMAHIGFDRAMGYGLKYSDDFKHTHLSNSK